jgi:nicotinamidase-related amidase
MFWSKKKPMTQTTPSAPPPAKPPIQIDRATTALVLIDLQNFTVSAATVPTSGQAVLANAVRLADACRAAGVPVVLVQVMGRKTEAMPVDAVMPAFEFPPGAHDLAADLGPKPGDLVVQKHTWGAFHGTDLYLKLRQRGVKTIILAGIATNYGVESTARQAHDRGYGMIIVSDAVSAFSQEQHDYPLSVIFPRIARIRTADEVLSALKG